MRILDGDQFLVRIFLGESDQFHRTPLARAPLERLRREGFAGATVIHGAAGFGVSLRCSRLKGTTTGDVMSGEYTLPHAPQSPWHGRTRRPHSAW